MPEAEAAPEIPDVEPPPAPASAGPTAADSDQVVHPDHGVETTEDVHYVEQLHFAADRDKTLLAQLIEHAQYNRRTLQDEIFFRLDRSLDKPPLFHITLP